MSDVSVKRSRRVQVINQAFSQLPLINNRSYGVLLNGLSNLIRNEKLPLPDWAVDRIPEPRDNDLEMGCEQALIDLVHSPVVPLSKAILLQGLDSIARNEAKWLVPRIRGEFKRYKNELVLKRLYSTFTA